MFNKKKLMLCLSKKALLKKSLLILFLFFFFTGMKIAKAYIDPGTGGVILSSFWQAAAAFFSMAFAFLIIKPVKKLVRKLKKNKKIKDGSKKI